MKHIPMKLWHSVPRALRSRRSIADTVTMKYRGFSRKSVCSLTHDIIPAAVLPDHVIVNVRRCSGRRCSSSRRGRAGHRCASGREAAVSSPPGREVGSRQFFYHRSFPPALDAVHLEQMTLIVPPIRSMRHRPCTERRDTRAGRENSPRRRPACPVRPFAVAAAPPRSSRPSRSRLCLT